VAKMVPLISVPRQEDIREVLEACHAFYRADAHHSIKLPAGDIRVANRDNAKMIKAGIDALDKLVDLNAESNQPLGDRKAVATQLACQIYKALSLACQACNQLPQDPEMIGPVVSRYPGGAVMIDGPYYPMLPPLSDGPDRPLIRDTPYRSDLGKDTFSRMGEKRVHMVRDIFATEMRETWDIKLAPEKAPTIQR
jgi:hypothetical protein